MKPDLRQEFLLAARLQDGGQLEDAVRLLKSLASRDPASTTILATLGGVYFDRGMFGAAAVVFEKATTLAPTSEAMSLGLFHSLWELGQRDEALQEIARFQAVGTCLDYIRIIKTINDA